MIDRGSNSRHGRLTAAAAAMMDAAAVAAIDAAAAYAAALHAFPAAAVVYAGSQWRRRIFRNCQVDSYLFDLPRIDLRIVQRSSGFSLRENIQYPLPVKTNDG